MPEYKMYEGSKHEQFAALRTKIQVFGGGYGNGKTAAAIVNKVLPIAKDYPGANILLARATYPKLNRTLRKEFFKWCPPHWIKSFNKSDNVCELVNGTIINFSHIQQRSSSDDGSSTSNLLSATYDLIVIDQIEDPEIMYKDFLDLMGRLRGMAEYTGDDPTMPRIGPRWFVIMLNPTGAWPYKRLVKPIHDHANGIENSNLIRDPDTGELMISLVEGSTYENERVVGRDFIKGLEATYKGQMRDRFLMGEWAAYEGLVYPQYESETHRINRQMMMKRLQDFHSYGVKFTVLEGFDHGIVSPSCYMLALVDVLGNVHCIDGFHEAELSNYEIGVQIKEIREKYIAMGLFNEDQIGPIFADPSLFKRGAGEKKVVGKTVADKMKEDEGIIMRRGNNEITNGIVRVAGFLNKQSWNINPYTGHTNAPRFYICDDLEWWENEITGYFWKKDAQTDEWTDVPRDKNDHAMDTMKYLLTDVKPGVIDAIGVSKMPAWMTWQEAPTVEKVKGHRYG